MEATGNRIMMQTRVMLRNIIIMQTDTGFRDEYMLY